MSIRYGDLLFPDAYAAPRYTPAEERRQQAEELRQELAQDWAEEFGLAELEPDTDPWEDEAA